MIMTNREMRKQLRSPHVKTVKIMVAMFESWVKVTKSEVLELTRLSKNSNWDVDISGSWMMIDRCSK